MTSTIGPFGDHDWAGVTVYDLDKVVRLFVHHAELAALARGTAKPPHAPGDANPVAKDPEAVKRKTVEEDLNAAATPGPAAATSSAAPGGRSRC
jgi:hypothetical protein